MGQVVLQLGPLAPWSRVLEDAMNGLMMIGLACVMVAGLLVQKYWR